MLKITKSELVARMRIFADKIESGEIDVTDSINAPQGHYISENGNRRFRDCINNYDGVFVPVISPPYSVDDFRLEVTKAFAYPRGVTCKEDPDAFHEKGMHYTAQPMPELRVEMWDRADGSQYWKLTVLGEACPLVGNSADDLRAALAVHLDKVDENTRRIREAVL